MNAVSSHSRSEIDHTAPRYDPKNDCYYVEYDREGSATVTDTVVHALATAASADVSESECSLYDCVDPHALELLFAPRMDGTPRTRGHVSFSALDHDVFVHASGDIYLYPPQRNAP